MTQSSQQATLNNPTFTLTHISFDENEDRTRNITPVSGTTFKKVRKRNGKTPHSTIS